MKLPIPSRLRFLVFAAASLMMVCWLYSFASSFVFASDGKPSGGCDFTLRYDEVRCVLDGIDPFAVTRGEAPPSPYVPFNAWSMGKMPLTGYTPWTYVLMLPFGLLPKWLAAAAYTLLELACVVFMFREAFRHALRYGLDEKKASMVACSLFVLLYPFTSAFGVGNFGIPFAAAIMIFAKSLEKGNWAIAGACWAFLMCKPQIGLLFAIPVLWHRQWKTLVAAVVLCVAGTIPVSLWLDVSPVELLVEVARDGDVGVYATDFLPLVLFRHIISVVPKGTVLALHAAVGVVACVYCTWKVRKSSDWWIRIAPASFFATVWTYGWPHDKSIYALCVIVAVVLYMQMERERPGRSQWIPLAFALLCGTYVFGAFLPGGSAHPLFGLIRRQVGFSTVPTPLRTVGWREAILCASSLAKTILAVALFSNLLPETPAYLSGISETPEGSRS